MKALRNVEMIKENGAKMKNGDKNEISDYKKLQWER